MGAVTATPLRLGVIGTGRMAARMIAAAAVTPDVGVVAVASSDGTRARAFAAAHGIERAVEGAAALAGLPEVDAVYIANRPADHAAACAAAAAAGKPALVEKPLASDPETAAAAQAAASAAGTLLVENLWTLALPSWRALLAAAQAQTVGRPVSLSFAFGYPMIPAVHPDLFAPGDGGVLLDRACYGLSLAIALFGPVETVAVATRRDGRGVDVAAALQLTHASGALSQIMLSIEADAGNVATVACSGGILRLAAPTLGGEVLEVCARHPLGGGDPLATIRPTDRLKASLRRNPLVRALRDRLTGPRRRRFAWGADMYAPMLAHFAALVREGATASDLAPPALSIEVARLTAAARRDAGL